MEVECREDHNLEERKVTFVHDFLNFFSLSPINEASIDLLKARQLIPIIVASQLYSIKIPVRLPDTADPSRPQVSARETAIAL